MIYSQRPEFISSIGLELTFMPKEIADRRNIAINLGLASKQINLRVQLARKLLEHTPCYVSTDNGGVVEVSPRNPFTAYDNLEAFYHTVMGYAKAEGAETMDRFYSTGGGHLHFDAKNMEEFFKIVRDVQTRPYLNWFFNDICDNQTANHMLWTSYRVFTDDDEDETQIAELFVEELRHYYRNFKSTLTSAQIGKCRYPVQKTIAVRFCGKISDSHYGTDKQKIHAEARFFGAPSNWEEQQLHIYFFQAYLAWIRAQPFKPVPMLAFEGRVKRFKKDYCIKEFRTLLSMIGLDFRDYERYIPNLEDRISFGPKWLI